MKNNISTKELFRKFVNNRCTPEERQQVFDYLKTADADDALHAIINTELVESMTNESIMDKQLSEEMYLNISKSFTKQNPVPVKKELKKINILRHYYGRLAAAFIGILMVTGILYIYVGRDKITTYTTAFGETITVTLPDASKVTLNGNSAIWYNTTWNEREPRQVWITGEAFFSVKHTRDNQKFIVNTSQQMNVEVLGTEFNVYNRKQTTRVVLNSGKVKLNRQNYNQDRPLTMTPGELVEFKENTKQYVKKNVNANVYSSWINKKLILENTSFGEIASLLEETYGLSVIVPEQSLYQERFSGIVPCENAGMLLKALSLSFNLKIQKSGNQVKFLSN